MSILSIVLVNIKENRYHIKELILMACTITVYSIPLEINRHFFTALYDVQIVLALSLSYALSMIFKVESNIQKRCIKIIKVMLPLLILMLNVISFDVRIIMSILLYILLQEEEKGSSLSLMSYLVISLFIVNWYVSSYFDSLLNIVNYRILDIQEYALLLGNIIAAICTVISISIWNDKKQESSLEIFWPMLYLVTTQKLLTVGSLKYEYIVLLLVVMAIAFFRYRKEPVIILVLSLIIGMLQIPTLYIAIVIGLLTLVPFKELLPAISLLEKIEKLKLFDVVCVLILIFTLQGNIAAVGIASIAMFLLSIKSITASYYIE